MHELHSPDSLLLRSPLLRRILEVNGDISSPEFVTPPHILFTTQKIEETRKILTSDILNRDGRLCWFTNRPSDIKDFETVSFAIFPYEDGINILRWARDNADSQRSWDIQEYITDQHISLKTATLIASREIALLTEDNIRTINNSRGFREQLGITPKHQEDIRAKILEK